MDTLKRINELREERNWSMYKLSKEAGIPQSTLTNLHKRGNDPTIPTLEAICDAFGISIAQFFSNDNYQSLTKNQMMLVSEWSKLNSVDREKVFAYIQGLKQ